MDEYKGLTDKELIARLKKYAIPHGPVVGTTRKLYEKKIYEYETERKKIPGRSEAYAEPTSSQSYMQETFISPRSREAFNYGREALGSTRTYFQETDDSRRYEEYTDARNEDPSPTKSYLSYNYSVPRREGRPTYMAEDWDVNSSESATSSYRYEPSPGSGSLRGAVSARQPIAEPSLYSSVSKDVSSVGDNIEASRRQIGLGSRDRSPYQTIFHQRTSGPSSLGVEPRRAIRPERQAPEAKDTGGSGGTRRYLPLWPQLSLFALLAAFLAFTYFFLQGNAGDNPFVKYLKH